MRKQLAATFLVITLVLVGPTFALNSVKHLPSFGSATNTNIVPATANQLGIPTDAVSMFDICLQDDSNGNSLQFNSTTGDYIFTTSSPSGFTLGGRGTITIRGSIITLQENRPDRRVLANIDNSAHRGTASVQVFSLGRTFTISSRNTNNSTCGTEYFISTNPNEPFILRVVTLRGETIDYFGAKDQQGLATALTSVRFQDANGFITNYQFDNQGRPSDILAFNGVRFTINWLSETVIQIIASSPNGSIQAGVIVDLRTGSILGQSTPNSDSPGIQNESYAKPTPIKPAEHSASNMSALSPVDFGQICSAAVGILNLSCLVISTISRIPGGAAVLCSALIAAVLAIPGGAAFVPSLSIACPIAFQSLQILCAAAGFFGGPDLEEIRRRFCEHVTPVNTYPGCNSFLSFVTGNPGIPGDGIFVNTGGGPFGDVAFQLSTPISLGSFTDGFTCTVFVPANIVADPQTFNIQYNIFAINRSSQCTVGAGTSGRGATVFNGVHGVFNNLQQSDIQTFVNILNQAGCNVTANDLYIEALLLGVNSPAGFQFVRTLDAATLCSGQNNFPGTRIQ